MEPPPYNIANSVNTHLITIGLAKGEANVKMSGPTPQQGRSFVVKLGLGLRLGWVRLG